MIIRVGTHRVGPGARPGVLYIGVNGFGIVAGGLGSTVGGFVAGVTSTPIAAAGRPGRQRPRPLEQPSSPTRREATADLVSPSAGLAEARSPDQGLPRPAGPAPDPDPGLADRRGRQDDHPGRPREGHQRLLGRHRRPADSRDVRAGPLRVDAVRPSTITSPKNNARQRQGGHDQGKTAGADHAPRAQ